MTRLLAIIAVLALAGCLTSPPPVVPVVNDFAGSLTVTGDHQLPVPYARIAFVAGDAPLAVLSTDAQGVLALTTPPGGTTDVVIGGAHHVPQRIPIGALPSSVHLEYRHEDVPDAGFLGFLRPVTLECPSVDPPPYSCARFGESVLEIAGDGTVWFSSTSAVGRSPPIWTSRDDGKTFQLLTGRGTGVVRDLTGIEGDFAIDDAGNVYFFDILAGAAYFTSYTAAGDHRWTVAQPFAPIVDRPWVRAGKADEVFVVYNRGPSTQFYASHDGGKTFDLAGGHTFDCGLGTVAQDPTERSHLVVVAACAGGILAWTTKDAGATWSSHEDVPMPAKLVRRTIHDLLGVGIDEMGRVYVAYSHIAPKPETVQADDWQRTDVLVARRDPSGWSGPWVASPGGVNHMPWLAAGRDGRITIGYYHADGDKENASSEWRLMLSASIDAAAASPQFQAAVADPVVLTKGVLDRQLGDFLEVRYAPDGSVGVSYSHVVRPEGLTGVPQNVARYVATDGGLTLGPLTFLNGPRPA